MHSPTQTSCFREFPLWVNISMTEHLGHTEYQPITPHGMWTCKCYVISGPLLHAHTGFNQLSSNSEVLCQCGLSLSSHQATPHSSLRLSVGSMQTMHSLSSVPYSSSTIFTLSCGLMASVNTHYLSVHTQLGTVSSFIVKWTHGHTSCSLQRRPPRVHSKCNYPWSLISKGSCHHASSSVV